MSVKTNHMQVLNIARTACRTPQFDKKVACERHLRAVEDLIFFTNLADDLE